MASYSANRKPQRPGAPGTLPRAYAAGLFTTYHPLRVESRFSVLFYLLILEDFAALLRAFVRAATVVDGLENYPIVLPPRSMAQVEFSRRSSVLRVACTSTCSRARSGNGNYTQWKVHHRATPVSAPLSFPLLPPLLRPPPGARDIVRPARAVDIFVFCLMLRVYAHYLSLALPNLSRRAILPGPHFTGISTSPRRLVARKKRKLFFSLLSASSSSVSSVYGDGTGCLNKGRARPLLTTRAWRRSESGDGCRRIMVV
jgi:hypothetical protein